MNIRASNKPYSPASPNLTRLRKKERDKMTFTLTARDGSVVGIPEEHLSGMTLENPGYCLDCGAERDGCEPDARKYPCYACESNSVYGAQELLLMGEIH